jgi:putative addiction module component (TIGR02574 family)
MAIRDRLAEESRSEALPVEADLCNELDRRWAAHLQNPAAALPWEQVRGQLGLG